MTNLWWWAYAKARIWLTTVVFHEVEYDTECSWWEIQGATRWGTRYHFAIWTPNIAKFYKSPGPGLECHSLLQAIALFLHLANQEEEARRGK